MRFSRWARGGFLFFPLEKPHYFFSRLHEIFVSILRRQASLWAGLHAFARECECVSECGCVRLCAFLIVCCHIPLIPTLSFREPCPAAPRPSSPFPLSLLPVPHRCFLPLQSCHPLLIQWVPHWPVALETFRVQPKLVIFLGRKRT